MDGPAVVDILERFWGIILPLIAAVVAYVVRIEWRLGNKRQMISSLSERVRVAEDRRRDDMTNAAQIRAEDNRRVEAQFERLDREMNRRFTEVHERFTGVDEGLDDIKRILIEDRRKH